MLKKIIRLGKLRHFVGILPLFTLVFGFGCDNRHYDDRLQMEVQQLDSDLMNRWATSGVVVLDIASNGPAHKAQLETGELISHVIVEYPVKSAGDFNSAMKKAL